MLSCFTDVWMCLGFFSGSVGEKSSGSAGDAGDMGLIPGTYSQFTEYFS